jgi:hypothetical protein
VLQRGCSHSEIKGPHNSLDIAGLLSENGTMKIGKLLVHVMVGGAVLSGAVLLLRSGGPGTTAAPGRPTTSPWWALRSANNQPRTRQ